MRHHICTGPPKQESGTTLCTHTIDTTCPSLTEDTRVLSWVHFRRYWHDTGRWPLTPQEKSPSSTSIRRLLVNETEVYHQRPPLRTRVPWTFIHNRGDDLPWPQWRSPNVKPGFTTVGSYRRPPLWIVILRMFTRNRGDDPHHPSFVDRRRRSSSSSTPVTYSYFDVPTPPPFIVFDNPGSSSTSDNPRPESFTRERHRRILSFPHILDYTRVKDVVMTV